MGRKMARSAPPPPFGPPGVAVVVRAASLACQNAVKAQKFVPPEPSEGSRFIHRQSSASVSPTSAPQAGRASACAATAPRKGRYRGNGRPGWHRQSIRAETATQNPRTFRRCITGALCISRIRLITHVRTGALGGRFKICLRRSTYHKRAGSFRCSTRWPAVPQLSPGQARVSVAESRAV